jgi:hypothetical protein
LACSSQPKRGCGELAEKRPIGFGIRLWPGDGHGALGLAVWLGYVFVGPESRAAAVLNLALLLPFVGVAQRLDPDRETARQLEPTPA